MSTQEPESTTEDKESTDMSKPINENLRDGLKRWADNGHAVGGCRRCGGEMRPGKAIAQTYTGAPDFPGCEVVTMSPAGPGAMVECLKCSECGHSVTPTQK